MDVCRLLEVEFERSCGGRVPDGWGRDPSLCLYVDLVDVVRDVRRLDARSDGVLAALVRRSPTDEWVASLVVVASLPLALARCRKGRAQVDELIGELAIAIGERGA